MDAKMTAEPQSIFYTLSWEGLHFEWQRGANVITLPSHNIEPCKLQHVLSAEGAKRLFMVILAEWIELRVESPGHVRIIASGSHVKDTEQPWPIVIPQIERALQNTTSMSLPFDSLSELEATIDIMSERHKQVMSSKDVGVYIENQTDKNMLVKFVGAEQTVKHLIENVKRAHKTYVQRNTQMMSLSSSPKDIKTYFEMQRYSVEIVEYIEATNFKQKFNEHYHDLKLTENKDDHAVFELYGPSVERIKQGFSFIDVYVNDLKQSELKLEDDFVSFVKKENVTVFLKLRLKEVSAYIIIGKCVTVWAADDKTLNEAKECFFKNIRSLDVYGWWSPDAKNIIRSNHEKIVCTFIGDTKKRILFTNDKFNEANQLAKVISESVHIDKTYTHWQWKVRAFVEFGALSKLQNCLRDTDIQVLDKQFIVRLQASTKPFLDMASKEVDECMTCIRKLETSPADENGIRDLIKRECVQEYLKAEHKIDGIITVDDGNGSSCFVYLARTSKDPLFKDIFGSILVDNKKLEGNAGKRFLEKHKDMIYIKENPTTVYLCMTRNIWSEFVTSQPETRKKINHAAFLFLRDFGSALLQPLESKYSLSLTMEEDCIVCLGDETVVQQCLEELDRMIAVSVFHLTDGRDGKEEDLSKVVIDEIANKHAVGIDILVECDSSLASVITKGKQYFAKWSLGNNNGTVAVADVDFSTSDACIDAVIIPVNSFLFGNNIFDDSKEDISYGKYFDKPSEKKQTGNWKRWACEKGHSCKYCFALVIANDVMASTVTEKTQGRMSIYKDRIKCGLLEIFGNIFNSGLSKICVVVPQDDSVITENVETIVQAFQEQHCKCKKQINAEIVFCLRRNPEEIMKNVDRSIKCIKSTAITRRELSTVVKGMFVQPKVKTTILLKSLEEVRADCYAVAVSHDVNLKKGPVSCAVSEAAGPGLQNFIKSHVNTILRDGETAVFEPFQLKERGVQKLIFGNLPKWKDKSNSTVIERFVEDCLLRADSLGCSSVAFPALGTGNLLCPPRDVVEAMLDGIAKYAAETTFGNIANVFICVIDEVIYQLLTIEKTMREDKISNATRISKDVTVLQAYAGKVRYRVVKKEDLATMSSIRYLHVHFGPDSDSTVDNTVMDCPWKIRIGTGTNKDALRQAMKKVISKCETDKITSIILFVHTGFEFSETDQIDIITESAVKETAKKNKDPYYLDDVIVVVEESTFDLFESTSRSGRGKSLVWKILPCSRNKSSTNFVIAGNKKEQVLIAKGKIQAMFQPKESGVSVEAEVSAQINPGIILYLKSLQNDFYGRWKEQVQQVYRIDIVEDEGENIVTLRGTFENIMNIETYLEKDFPSFPTATPFPKNSQNVEVVKRDSKENKKSDQQNKKKGTTLCLHHFEFTTRKLKVIIQCKDITCVATDFIVSEVGTAISQRIAEKAGQSYKDVLKSTLDKELGHHEGRCIRTDPGSLNCREVIHVFCPQKSEEVTVEKLIQLSSSMLSCLKTADSQYGESVAIPFLCAEFWQMGLCVHEYFRALTEFNEPTLRQVYLVDSDVGKVNSAIMELTKSVEKSGNKISHAASSMAIISNDKCIKLHVTTGNLSVVSADAIVVVEDTSLSLSNDTAKQIYEHGGPKFQQTYEELRSRQHKISEVICVPYLNVKQVLIAFPPAWKKQDSVFSRQICTTVDNVFSNVSSLNDVKSIAMSCFYSGDETEVTRLCCGMMINQLVRCFADISTTLKEIHFIFPNSKDVSIILQEIMEKIPLEGGK